MARRNSKVEEPPADPTEPNAVLPEEAVELPPPPPADRWATDVLGAGFQARTLPLHDDDEGEVAATLVRHVPADDPGALPGTPSSPAFAVLYLHGWNDYFYQRELARRWSADGGAFYALDLRKYGRSLRAHQTRGFMESLTVYDEDIHAALKVVRAELGVGTDLVLMGHSTGGLTAALWAHRHPGACGRWCSTRRGWSCRGRRSCAGSPSRSSGARQAAAQGRPADVGPGVLPAHPERVDRRRRPAAGRRR
ncbi:alpha/beta hydrolase [Georgenia sp. SUBG003]|uniref:alpha/beta hydrolase n=1 Tax=Georgenia sp. SUBG003 TaxID=1497974 RepID=UPI003AB261EC